MLLSPLENTPIKFLGGFGQLRPRITQEFGENPELYKQFGLRSHNGTDFSAKTGTTLFAPCEGKVEVKDSGSEGYGLHITITKSNLRVILAHLSEAKVKDGDYVHFGEIIGLTGNSGFSSAPHLHVTVKMLNDKGNVSNYDNGYFGAIPFKHLMITFKGTFDKQSL